MVVLACLAVALGGALSADGAFVSAPTSAPGRHLRARGDVSLAWQQATAQRAGARLSAACAIGSLLVAVGAAATHRAAVARRATGEEMAAGAAQIPRPEDLLESPKFPLFMGSTGGYMSKATRERHAITWTAKDAYQFEMPTGGMAIMNKGENLCYFRKKEQCIAVGKQLRKMKIENYKIYRLKKDGTVIFLHPADGVFPEKVNKGRVQVNGRPFTVAQNPQPGMLKWTKYHMKSYEADPLTTMFVKARLMAWQDQENLFPLPQPEGSVAREDWPEYSKKMQEALKSL